MKGFLSLLRLRSKARGERVDFLSWRKMKEEKSAIFLSKDNGYDFLLSLELWPKLREERNTNLRFAPKIEGPFFFYSPRGKRPWFSFIFDLWLNSKHERNAAMFYLSVCDQNRAMKDSYSSFLLDKKIAIFLYLSVRGQNQEKKISCLFFISSFVLKIEFRLEVKTGTWKILSPLGLWPKLRNKRTAAFFLLSIHGQIAGRKERDFLSSLR